MNEERLLLLREYFLLLNFVKMYYEISKMGV